jgi:RNA polymerase sigma-70 factor (ECF subfamily)
VGTDSPTVPPLSEIVRLYAPVVTGLGQSLGLRGADLDDAAADVFAQVYQSLGKFRGDSQLGTWVYRIAVRVMTRARTRNRNRRSNSITTDPPAAGESVGDGLMDREIAAAVWAAVATLDPRSAAVVEFYYRQGWPVEKIAEVLECPVGTVKTLLFRARAKLKPVLIEAEVYP